MSEKPEQSEIDDVLNQCLDSEDTGQSKFPGMSYEQGVKAGIQWLTEEFENPMND